MDELVFVCLCWEKPICLVCNESVAAMKEYNIKRHYDTKHSKKFADLQGQLRIDKAESLKKQLERQQHSFRKHNEDSEAVVKVSYIISEKIARKSKPFTDGEFIKECLEDAADVLSPLQKSLYAKVSLSGVTVARRIEDLAGDIERTLSEHALQFVYYSIALDESTDLTDTAQLAVFIRGIDTNFVVTEEMAALVPMKGSTKGSDLYESFNAVINRYNLNLAGITTDGAPAMVGKNEGLVALVKKSNPDVPFVQYHCIIHQENLCAKSVNIKDVMSIVVKTVNFIKSRGLNHRQFQEFLKETNAEYGDIIYFCDVRWLSRGKMLKRVFDLRNEISNFMKTKNKDIPHFSDKEWLADLGFLTDITSQLNNLNEKLQGKNNLVHELFDYLKAFELKLELWISQFQRNIITHFPHLSLFQISNMNKYTTALQDLKTQFQSRFHDFRRDEKYLNLFARPFTVSVEEVPEEFQMELIEIQCNSALKDKFND
ncbi:general transcription factor II-I repeat domain-containing protein 2-like [Leguminivora glycinivorella]|uniref:general transcription factor II-I repeat domain-containing protein 2-like n=1 Tax=Leguminivora glycinivorella TaxID=1035111 RepID=UPI00200D612E|nr:general transcription factor II-I repeat domain-containing protein 2-like [Leguminivora glycinivorella]